MDQSTRDFVDSCLENVAEDIRNLTPEDIDRAERHHNLITLNSSAALETLEQGQWLAYQSKKDRKY